MATNINNYIHKIVYEYKLGTVDNKDIKVYEALNPGYKCTGETLEERYSEMYGSYGCAITYVVMKGNRTLYGMCRDCGDHYIIARYSRYDRIDKGTFKIAFDVDDI